MKTMARLICALGFPLYAGAETLTLAENQKTDYVIVNTSNHEIDRQAAEELRYFLNAVSGADFKISGKPGRKNIYLDTDPQSEKDSCRIRRDGDNLHLSGSGTYGRLNSVYEFLESLGIRWFSAYGDIRLPRFSKIVVENEEDVIHYPFRIRGSQTFFFSRGNESLRKPAALYHYRNRQNILLSEFPGIKNAELQYRPVIHALSCYLHPGIPHRRLNPQLKWIKNRNYFKDHPEWFPMDEKGKRYPHGQLCFSNPQLQAELTRNALIQLEREISRTGRDDGIFSMSMNDITYKEFCCCPECRKAGIQFQHKGAGAYYKYLFDFCRLVKKRYPKVRVSAFAHLSSIYMPGNLAVPDNLIIIFCPIYSSYVVPLTQEPGQPTLKQLKSWLTSPAEVWYWYYTLPYAGGIYLTPPPVSNLNRISKDLITMRDAGVKGTYFEHDSGGRDRSGFFEMQSFLLLRLYRNPDEDIGQIIFEFTEFYYGKAAPLFRKYLYEVEQGCQAMAGTPIRSVYNSFAFPYLNPENLRRWSRYFDELETLAADNPDALYHVKLARVAVDAAYITVTADSDSWPQTEHRIGLLEKRIQQLHEKYHYSFDMSRLAKWYHALKQKLAGK